MSENKTGIRHEIIGQLRQWKSEWFTRGALLTASVTVVIFLLFFWVFLSPPLARPQDIAVTHLLLIPFLWFTALAGWRKGYRRLWLYPVLLLIIVAAEMLNFSFADQYSVERPVRYGCSLVLSILLADIGLTFIGTCLKAAWVTLLMVVAVQLSSLLLFVGIIIRNVFGKKHLETDTVAAIFQTDLMEAVMFVVENPSLGAGLIVLLVLSGAGWIWYARCKWFSQPVKLQYRLILIAAGIGLCTVALISVSALIRKGKMSTFALILKGNYFREELARFNREAAARKLVPLTEAEKKLVGSKGENGRFILIIGESNSRDYMSCYGYKKSTTPFLDRMKNNENFTFFTNVYSNHVHTNEALKYLFSEQNQYNPASRFKVTLFDVLRYCGYYSTLISNQYFYDSARSQVSAIMQAADERFYLNDEMDFVMKRNRLDMETVVVLKKLPSRPRELIVIHLMSCHAPYQIRFPADFRPDLPGNYERATAYLDQVLQEIFEYAIQDDSVKGVIFIPDHGEDVEQGDHDSAGFTVDMIRIPMICYFNPQYTAGDPEFKQRLKKARNKIFTNDLMFDFMLDVMGIKTKFNDGTLHLFSDNYRIDMECGRTLHGRCKLDGDILKK